MVSTRRALCAVSLLLAFSACSSADPTADSTTPNSSGEPGGSTPVSTPATPDASTPEPTSDPSTGLVTSVTSPQPRPSGTTLPPAEGVATLTITAGSESLSMGDGSCSEIEGYTYVFVGTNGGMGGVLSWQTENPALGQVLTWQYGESTDTAQMSTHGIDRTDGITIHFDSTGEAGTMEGWYIMPTTYEFRQFTGAFSCLAAPFFLSGDHPLSLLASRCTTGSISAGGPGSADAAYLAYDSSLADAATQEMPAGLSWRVGGTTYSSNWLVLLFDTGGVSGRFVGEGVGPDGVQFPIKGAFNCTGG